MKNLQHPHPKQTDADGMPVMPPWQDHQAELPDGPPKQGHGPPMRTPQRGSTGTELANQQQNMSNAVNLAVLQVLQRLAPNPQHEESHSGASAAGRLSVSEYLDRVKAIDSSGLPAGMKRAAKRKEAIAYLGEEEVARLELAGESF